MTTAFAAPSKRENMWDCSYGRLMLNAAPPTYDGPSLLKTDCDHSPITLSSHLSRRCTPARLPAQVVQLPTSAQFCFASKLIEDDCLELPSLVSSSPAHEPPEIPI